MREIAEESESARLEGACRRLRNSRRKSMASGLTARKKFARPAIQRLHRAIVRRLARRNGHAGDTSGSGPTCAERRAADLRAEPARIGGQNGHGLEGGLNRIA